MENYRYVRLHERTDARVDQGCKRYDVELVAVRGDNVKARPIGQVFSELVYNRGHLGKRWRSVDVTGSVSTLAYQHERFAALAALLKRTTNGIGSQDCTKLAREASTGVKR